MFIRFKNKAKAIVLILLCIALIPSFFILRSAMRPLDTNVTVDGLEDRIMQGNATINVYMKDVICQVTPSSELVNILQFEKWTLRENFKLDSISQWSQVDHPDWAEMIPIISFWLGAFWILNFYSDGYAGAFNEYASTKYKKRSDLYYTN